MAESMPGTMSIFAEAFAQQTSSGLTGQAALAALYEAIPTGKVKSADLLPIVAEIMSRRAEPKIGALRKTSMAEQARLGNALQDLVNVFSKSGGEEGFARFFKSLTDAMQRLTPVVEGLSKAFNWMTKQLEAPLLLLGDLGTHFQNLQRVMDNLNPSAMKFAGIGALMLTRWGRLGAIFSALFLILEDISVGVLGGDSYTRDFFTFLEKFVEFDKGIMGVAMALLTVAGAMKLLKGAAISLPKIPGVPGGPTGGGSKGVPMSTAGPAAGVLGLAAYWGMNSDEFQQRMQQDYDFQQIVNSVLAPLVPGMVALGGGQDPRLNMLSPDQRAEYIKGRSRPSQQGMWENLDGYLNYKSSKDAQWKLDNQHLSDIPSIPSVDTALGQAMQQPINNTNNVTNTFQFNIDGVTSPAALQETLDRMMPEFEKIADEAASRMWSNELDVTNTAFGSK